MFPGGPELIFKAKSTLKIQKRDQSIHLQGLGIPYRDKGLFALGLYEINISNNKVFGIFKIKL